MANLQAFRIRPYIKPIVSGDWVSTNTANEYMFVSVEQETGKVIMRHASGMESIVHPSNLVNVMVRDTE